MATNIKIIDIGVFAKIATNSSGDVTFTGAATSPSYFIEDGYIYLYYLAMPTSIGNLIVIQSNTAGKSVVAELIISVSLRDPNILSAYSSGKITLTNVSQSLYNDINYLNTEVNIGKYSGYSGNISSSDFTKATSFVYPYTGSNTGEAVFATTPLTANNTIFQIGKVYCVGSAYAGFSLVITSYNSEVEPGGVLVGYCLLGGNYPKIYGMTLSIYSNLTNSEKYADTQFIYNFYCLIGGCRGYTGYTYDITTTINNYDKCVLTNNSKYSIWYGAPNITEEEIFKIFTSYGLPIILDYNDDDSKSDITKWTFLLPTFDDNGIITGCTQGALASNDEYLTYLHRIYAYSKPFYRIQCSDPPVVEIPNSGGNTSDYSNLTPNVYSTTESLYGSYTKYKEQEFLGDETDVSEQFSESPYNAQVVANAVNAYVCTSAQITAIRNAYATFASDHLTTATVVSQFLGADIYKSVVDCRIYPLEIPHVESTTDVNTLGGVTLVEGGAYSATSLYSLLDFGTITPNVTDFYQIQNSSAWIYCPYAGNMPINITGADPIHLLATVDFVTGNITYYCLKNGQLYATLSGEIGSKIPINAEIGARIQNAVKASIELVSMGLGVAGAAAGAYGISKGLPINSDTITTFTDGVGSVGDLLPSAPVAPSSVTGTALGQFGAPQVARMYYTEPKLITDTEGYPETNGLQKAYKATLGDLINKYVKCYNYQPNCTATSTEKSELASLLNSGVII